MPWSWVRPVDPDVLAGRPLLDLGVGDAQTLSALVTGSGLVVGIDRSPDVLKAARVAGRAHLARAEAEGLPFAAASFATVLAADLVHHLDDDALRVVLGEVRRVLRGGGTFVAWWYETTGRPGPGSPAHPRAAAAVELILVEEGFGKTERLALELVLEPAPRTVGLVASR